MGLIRFTKQGQQYVQSSYGAPCRFASLRRCSRRPVLPISTRTLPPIVNDVVFDRQGNAYVTDSTQATIFRYAPGGDTPTIWFQSPLLEGGGSCLWHQRHPIEPSPYPRLSP